MGRNVLTLSHLYPSTAFPGWGPFVRDEVVELSQRHTMAVVAPLPWLWRVRSAEARRVRAVPRESTEDGVRVVRPRFPAMRVGNQLVEPRLWATRLHPLLRRMYSEIGGDLVHAHFALPDGFAAAHYASREHVPLVLTIWGSDVLLFGRRRIARSLLRHTFDRTQAIIAVSDELAERAEQLGAVGERIHVIRGGVPYPPLPPRETTRAQLDIAADAVCILWVGGFVPVKRPLDAVRAFGEVARSTARNMHLVMIGSGPLLAETRNYVRERHLQETVRLLGHCGREEVWRWHCAADVLVNSSRSEGTPRVVLEALGAGTPVAAYPLPGIRAILDVVPGGGTLASDGTPGGLAAAVADELAADRDRGGLACAARKRFHITETARAIDDVYEAVL